ncbi:acyltransferase domain-containing protein [Actinokineospora sp. NBRC 105648]|uniref:acyltransferase domain-containing protein n=1 Tax=Actinokineospora sp. NBRC 105648 TaxID=3032206 RepID=UPI002553CF25|nr:acyltransferase domain-containing protein [Actinokineospora sp. NBRC 105648]
MAALRPLPVPSTSDRSRRVALLLPGQGSQYRRMAAGLYDSEPVFTAAMDEVFTALGKAGRELRADWLDVRPHRSLDDAVRSQPLLFAVDHALGRLVLDQGVEPAALLGHSVGEMAAAALAGVFSAGDAAGLVLDRVRRLASAPAGGMLAVAASAAQVEPFLGAGVVVGAVNAPRHTVLAGPRPALDAVAGRLTAAGFASRPVASDTAFHSPVLAPWLAGAPAQVASVARTPPSRTIYSGRTAAPLSADQAVDPGFWAAHPVTPVLFWPALDALLSTGDYLLVETGPGRTLTGIARRHPTVRRGASAVLPLLSGGPVAEEADRASWHAAVAELRASGVCPVGPAAARAGSS